MKRGALIVFLKAPRVGRVKTRLGKQIGAGRAAALFRKMIERTLKEARGGAWRVVLAIDPPADRDARIWPRGCERIAQSDGDLGRRMNAALRHVRGGPVVIVGADAPAMRSNHLREAFLALGSADVVFGPATDGGYWLIGCARRRSAPKLFRNVRWSSPHALADTLASLPPDFRIAWLPALRDIDCAKDLIEEGPLLLSLR
jgi:rSAM/selenodomain-associated transferase 1